MVVVLFENVVDTGVVIHEEVVRYVLAAPRRLGHVDRRKGLSLFKVNRPSVVIWVPACIHQGAVLLNRQTARTRESCILSRPLTALIGHELGLLGVAGLDFCLCPPLILQVLIQVPLQCHLPVLELLLRVIREGHLEKGDQRLD